jgi:DNA-binding beta-propeller fold protein YncE
MCSWHVNVNPSTKTIYVTNASGNTVSLINGATCNATVTCSQNAPAVPVEQLPAGLLSISRRARSTSRASSPER